LNKRNLSIAVLLISLVFLLVGCSAKNSVLKNADVISENIRSQYCSDSRTSIWKINVSYYNGNYILKGETDNEDAIEEFVDTLQRGFSNITFSNEIILLPDDAVGEFSFGLPMNSVATLRRNPSVTEEIVTQTLMGIPMEILKEEDEFFLVRTDDGYLGWVSDDRIIQGNDSLRKSWEESPKVVYTDIEGMVYSNLSMNSQPISDCVLGNRFRFISKKGDWTKVGYADGRIGYIPSEKLIDLEKYLSKPVDPNEILKTASILIGRPYLWGAASTKVMDCSGFTQTVFRNNGYLLPRDASMQVNEGIDVDTTNFPVNLKQADLLFFGPSSKKITHVGIYIGNYQFIHCAGRVRIDSFDPKAPNYNKYRRKVLRRVKRIARID